MATPAEPATEEVETPVTEETPTEETTTEDPAKGLETTEETTEETPEVPEGETPPEETPTEEETTEETPEGETEEPVDEKERNRRGFADRTRIKNDVTRDIGPQVPTQTAEELVGEGMDPAMAEVEALRQEVQRDKVISSITELNSSLNTDANQILRDFPVFDENNKKDYDGKFAKDVEAQYKKYSGYTTDQTGAYVLNANFPLYEFYAWAAGLRGSGTKAGAVQGQKQAEQMIAAAETPASTGPVEKPTTDDDNFLKGLKGETTNTP